MMTPENDMTIDDLLNAFATAGNIIPQTALEQAAARWADVAPVLLELLGKITDKADTSERSYSIIFYAIYLMAQMKESRAFSLICELAIDKDQIEMAIYDGVTEDLPGILVHTFNGNQVPLRRLIEAPDAYQYTRSGALEALAWLTVIGRIDRSETQAYLRDLYTTLQPQDECYVWQGWEDAIAGLGLTALIPLVEEAFQRKFISAKVMSVHHFHKDMQASQATPGISLPRSVTDQQRFDDLITFFSRWYNFQTPQEIALSQPATRSEKIGRNDPCYCGSQKKYKKCCLVL